MNRLVNSNAADVSEAVISKKCDPGIHVTCVEHGETRELLATLRPTSGETVEALFQRCMDFLQKNEASLIHHTVLGPVAAYREYREQLDEMFRATDCPVTWVEGGACGEAPISGLHLHAIAGVTVETIHVDDQPVGRCYEDDDARYLYLGDIHARDLSGDRLRQAAMMYKSMEEALRNAGMDIHNVVRTWLFLKQLLTWYGDFNKVRNELFTQRGVFDAIVPASTGIEAINSGGAEIVAGAFALRAKHQDARVEAVPSPLQCPAPGYGSAFSRAAEVRTPNVRRLYVSGTASIALDGESQYSDDPEAQITRTMDVVEAILTARGLGFSDTTRATAYVKHPDVAPLFMRYCEQNGLIDMPVVTTRCDVCREELLFELELDALGPVSCE